MPENSNPNKAESQMTLASSRSTPEERQMEIPNGQNVDTFFEYEDTLIDSESSCSRRRTTTEKALIVAVCLATFVVIGLGISLSAVVSGYKKAKEALVNSSFEAKIEQKDEICLTKGCIQAAAMILENIDTDVDPCEDFYRFSCGSHDKNVVIPDEKTAVTQFSNIQDTLQQKLRLVVDQDISSNDSVATVLVKNLFKSCMNVDRIEEQGILPLRKILDDMGGWPVVLGDAWDEESFSWTETIYTNRRMGYSIDYLIDFSVTIDIKNSTFRIIDLDQPPLGMPSRKYLMRGMNDSDVKAYHTYQVSLAVMLGAEKEAAQRELKDILEFEVNIANFSKDNEDRRNMSELYNRITIAELTTMIPDIPWLEYTNNLLNLENVEITEEEPIIVNVPEYIKKLAELLQKTPKRVIANYIMWRVASASVGFLSNNVRDIQLLYSKQLTGKGTRAPRWKECMAAVSGSLPHAVGALYAKNFFKENAKDEADEMVAYLRAEFDNILRAVDWMDEKTRSLALKKAQAIVAHIAYPKELLIDENLEELYKNLQISDGDLLDNMRNLTIFGTDFSFGELRKKVDKGHWRNHGAAAVVNAFYSPLENSIQFPAGILQGVFFNADRPKYLNYGGIGFVIGHEITHGFDDRGRQFDEEGNLFNWWEPETQEKFIEKSKCIIWQYGNYSVTEVGLNVNGVNTQGENIADNGGIVEAYRAYNQWVVDNGEEPKLPGISYSPNQLFWISSAHVWCSKYRPETLKLRLITSLHSPVQFRVNGPLSNLNEFSQDWNCPLGSKMNPNKKCRVW